MAQQELPQFLWQLSRIQVQVEAVERDGDKSSLSLAMHLKRPIDVTHDNKRHHLKIPLSVIVPNGNDPSTYKTFQRKSMLVGRQSSLPLDFLRATLEERRQMNPCQILEYVSHLSNIS